MEFRGRQGLSTPIPYTHRTAEGMGDQTESPPRDIFSVLPDGSMVDLHSR